MSKNKRKAISMKKILKSVSVFVLLLSTVLSIVSCGIFDDGKSGGFLNEPIDITIYNGDEANTYTVTTGKTAVVGTVSKQGYFFKGYYSEENGGEQYFDNKGNSLVTWKKGFPTTLYAQWQSIYELEYNSKVYFEDPYDSRRGEGYTFSIPEDFKNAIAENPSAKLKISVKLSAKYSSDHNYPVTLKLMDMEGAESELLGEQTQPLYSNYNDYQFDFEVDAHCLKKGKFYLFWNNKGVGYWVCMYVKDLTYTLSFEK